MTDGVSGVDSIAPTEDVGASGNDTLDSLLWGVRWDSDTGSSTTTLSFSFPDANSQFNTGPGGYPDDGDLEPFSGLTSVSNVAQGLFRGILQNLETFTNLSFVEVEDSGDSAGTIRLANTGIDDDSAVAWAYLPGAYQAAGDIWIISNNHSEADVDYTHTLLHELGHALGLKHSFEAENGFPAIDSSLEGVDFTVMSYTVSARFSNAQWQDLWPQTYMYADILALQYLYGKDTVTTAGADSYTYSADERYFLTIWDYGGDDTLSVTGASDVKLNLTPGTWSNVGTTIEYWDGANFTYDSDTVFIMPDTIIENATGADGDDTIIGNDVANLLIGGGGADTLSGGAGADTLVGGAGADTLTGGAGADVFRMSQTGSDSADEVVDFEDGVDLIDFADGETADFSSITVTQVGDDVLVEDSQGNSLMLRAMSASDVSVSDFVGLSGGQSIIGTDAAESFTGGDDDDTINGGNGSDTLDGGDGDDSLFGGNQPDVLMGGNGKDILKGSNGADTLSGGTAFDDLSGGNGNDLLQGDGAGDRLRGDPGADTLDGGAGVTDQAYYFFSDAPVNVDLEAGTASGGYAEGDVILNIESVVGSTGNDTLSGQSGGGRLAGAGGDDLLTGLGGRDRVEGGNGNDTLFGGAGDDQLIGGRGDDVLTGGAGDDTLRGNTGADTFVFGAGSGDDVIIGFRSDDTLDLSETTTDFTSLADVQAAATETGAGVLIDLGGGASVLLQDVTLSDLSSEQLAL